MCCRSKGAEREGIPYATYHFPDPSQDMREQARKYVDWVGAEQPLYILDIETPYRGTSPPNRAEMLKIIDELEGLTNLTEEEKGALLAELRQA